MPYGRLVTYTRVSLSSCNLNRPGLRTLLPLWGHFVDHVERTCVHAHRRNTSRASSSHVTHKRTQNASQIHAELHKSFRAGKLRSIEARKRQILQLAYLLKDNYDRFKETFARDLGRPSLEVSLCVPHVPSL